MPDPKKRVPVDTVALKKKIAQDDQDAALARLTMAEADKDDKESTGTLFFNQAVASQVAANRGRAQLDSARAGQIPATDGKRVLKGKRK